MARFAGIHPDVSVGLQEGDIATLQRALVIGALELALIYDLALSSEITREPLAALEPYAVLPAKHPLASRKHVPIAALASEPFILLDLPQSREYFLAIFLAYGIEPTVRYAAPSIEMVRGLVAQGHGVGLLNIRPAGDEAYDGSALAYRPLEEDAPPLRIVLARPAQARPTRAAQALITCAKDYFARARACNACIGR
ncbi:MAG TPA: LysR substrate-binding domain-containing protein [Alphaproteobacteria bacterium]|nr:LysR substrate-binding domain-containing protein [Alphaproteobacteria bacterium]